MSLKCLFFSDVHLFHRRVRTASIVERLLATIRRVLTEIDLDYIVIAGDLFDDIRFLPDDEVFEAQELMKFLLNTCCQLGIKLRCMEGTKSHDRGQPKQFITLNTANDTSAIADFVYINEISILKENDGSVWLYVPDNVHPDPDVVWEMVLEKMAQENVSTVDFTVTHSEYEHHISIPNRRGHVAERYIGITNFYVVNGHIHQKSFYKNKFITIGSFDRLAHDEEEPKGLWTVEISPTSRTLDVVRFHENVDATVMKTINLKGHSLDSAMATVLSHCEPARFLRLDWGDAEWGPGLFKHFQGNYPEITWSSKKPKKKEKISDKLFSGHEEVPVVTADTIEETLLPFLLRNSENEEEAESARKELAKFI